MIRFGITEAGDAGLDFSWENKLLDGNIIITKHMTISNQKLNKALLKNKDKIILHATCTGYGGTKVEPNVPKPYEIYQGVRELIKAGFPNEQIVLRVDPIIPTEKGLKTIIQPLALFKDTGVTRVRYSIIDMYPHVKERFLKEFGVLPFNTFKAPPKMIDNLMSFIEKYRERYTFEACAEELPDKVGCISQKDFEILGLDTSQIKEGGFQRKGCACCAGKTELLKNKKRCPSGCIYCYWRD
jgi:DNA repair photolyase